MAVLLEALSVIVRKVSLEEKYPGGVAQYEIDSPTRTFCMDDRLTRVGFMAPPDVETFIGRLMYRGLIFFDGHQLVDIAVVDQFQGPTRPCPWLDGARTSEGFAAAWEAGTPMGRVAFPDRWTPSKLNFVPNHEVASRLLPLAKEGAMDVVLDYKTGQEVFISRPFQK